MYASVLILCPDFFGRFNELFRFLMLSSQFFPLTPQPFRSLRILSVYSQKTLLFSSVIPYFGDIMKDDEGIEYKISNNSIKRFVVKTFAVAAFGLAMAATGTYVGVRESDAVNRQMFEYRRSYDISQLPSYDHIESDIKQADKVLRHYRYNTKIESGLARICKAVDEHPRYSCKQE
jgi:isopentenyl phosphate kinase